MKNAKFGATTQYMFYDGYAPKAVNMTGADLSATTNVQYMFNTTSYLQEVNMTNVKMGTTMQSMFASNTGLTRVIFTGINFSNVTSM